jgi:hypothetical protein
VGAFVTFVEGCVSPVNARRLPKPVPPSTTTTTTPRLIIDNTISTSVCQGGGLAAAAGTTTEEGADWGNGRGLLYFCG